MFPERRPSSGKETDGLGEVELTPGANGQSLLVAPCIGCLWGIGMKSSRHFQKEVILFIPSLDLAIKMG